MTWIFQRRWETNQSTIYQQNNKKQYKCKHMRETNQSTIYQQNNKKQYKCEHMTKINSRPSTKCTRETDRERDRQRDTDRDRPQCGWGVFEGNSICHCDDRRRRQTRDLSHVVCNIQYSKCIFHTHMYVQYQLTTSAKCSLPYIALIAASTLNKNSVYDR